MEKFDNVYQFKITLKDVEPPVWRRVLVPETCTFYDLHTIIQDAMGWEDYHLHAFEIYSLAHLLGRDARRPDPARPAC